MNALILHAGIARHNGDWNWQNVRSPFARIYYVTEGSAQIVFKKKVCTLTPGKLYLVPPFTTHSNRCEGLFTHYYVHIYEPADRVSGLFEDYAFPLEVAAERGDEWLFERLCVINSGKRLPQSDPRSYDTPEGLLQSVAESGVGERGAEVLAVRMESHGIVNQLLSRFLGLAVSARLSSDSRIRKVRKHIRCNLDKVMSVETLAEMVYLSKDHFIRLFKRECGESPLQYINHRKIELAEIQLITTNSAVKEIAYNLGFADYSYFTRLFRQTTGTTPAVYRRTAVKKT